MIKIENEKIYRERMAAAIKDKAWFLGSVQDCDTIVDFGCADGALLSYIYKRHPGKFTLIGYDTSKEMISHIKDENIVTFTDMDNLKKYLSSVPVGKTCLILSSVIHEVYSYGTDGSVRMFWDFVYNSGFDYVVIRDMAVSKIEEKRITGHIPTTIVTHEKYKDFIQKNCSDGTVSYKDVLHFLLKYRYVENWEREVSENYFPVYIEDIIRMVPDGYQITMAKRFMPAFIRNKIKEDFSLCIEKNTHYKMFIKKN